MTLFKAHHAVRLLLALLALSLSACATRQALAPVAQTEVPSAGQPRLDIRRVGLVYDSRPAVWSFQKAKGQLGSAWEGVPEGAEMVVQGMGAGVQVFLAITESDLPVADGYTYFAAGAVGGAVAAGSIIASSFVAPYHMIRSWQHLNAAELAQAETNLISALTQMADQEIFRAWLQKVALSKCPDRLIALRQDGSTEDNGLRPDTLLEARIEELRLERTAKGENSYVLRVRTQVRFLGREDGTVLYDQSFEYRSERELFVRWTEPGGLQSVADTGYHMLANYIIDQLLVRP